MLCVLNGKCVLEEVDLGFLASQSPLALQCEVIMSFVGLLIVAVVAFLAPLLLAISPARRRASIVLEIVAGILIGPSVLGWVKVDLPISTLSILGLRFLIFLSGLEVDLQRL